MKGPKHISSRRSLLASRWRKMRMCRRCSIGSVAPSFKNKTKYTPYVSPGSQITRMATNRGNIYRKYLIYNVLNTKNIILDSRQRKDTPSFRRKLQIHRTTDWLISLTPPDSSNLVPIRDFFKELKSKASISTYHTQQYNMGFMRLKRLTLVYCG